MVTLARASRGHLRHFFLDDDARCRTFAAVFPVLDADGFTAITGLVMIGVRWPQPVT